MGPAQATLRARLDKLSREISRLQRARTMEDAEDHAFNCALTAWHLTDWVWVAHFRDDSAARQKIGLAAGGHHSELKREFNKYVADQSPELRLCQDIANGLKHVVAKVPRGAKHPGVSKTETKSRTEVLEGGGRFDKDGVLQGPLPGGAGAITGTSYYEVWITDGLGTDHKALDVFRATMSFWDDFLSRTHN